MAKISDAAKTIGKYVASIDRTHIKYRSSLVERAQVRARSIGESFEMCEPARAAAYPLAWGLSTGRASSEFEAALVALTPARFAQIAIDIANKPMSVRDAWEAWKAAVAAPTSLA